MIKLRTLCHCRAPVITHLQHGTHIFHCSVISSTQGPPEAFLVSPPFTAPLITCTRIQEVEKSQWLSFLPIVSKQNYKMPSCSVHIGFISMRILQRVLVRLSTYWDFLSLPAMSHCLAPIRPVPIKEDILQCDSAQLAFALSRFIQEVRRPNGETYSADSIFYLCLGIQQVTQLGNARQRAGLITILIGSLQVSANSFPSLGTAPVHERSHWEHLHRPALQWVLVKDQHHAPALESSSSAQWYDLSFLVCTYNAPSMYVHIGKFSRPLLRNIGLFI